MLQPTDRLTVQMEAQQWNTLLALLHDAGPYRVVAPLIATIQRQCQDSDNEAAPPAAHAGNGVSPPAGAHV